MSGEILITSEARKYKEYEHVQSKKYNIGISLYFFISQNRASVPFWAEEIKTGYRKFEIILIILPTIK